MSDTVALSLISLVVLVVNLAFSVRASQVNKCGSKPCQDALREIAGK